MFIAQENLLGYRVSAGSIYPPNNAIKALQVHTDKRSKTAQVLRFLGIMDFIDGSFVRLQSFKLLSAIEIAFRNDQMF